METIKEILDDMVRAWYNLKWFFHNIKVFWKILWKYRDWDYAYLIDVNTVCLTQLANRIEKGNEDKRASSKKVAKIRELITLLNRNIEDEYLIKYKEQISKGKTTYQKVFEQAEIEKRKNAKAMFQILLGQDPKKFNEKYKKALEQLKTEHPETDTTKIGNYDVWVQLFDGSGIESWWD